MKQVNTTKVLEAKTSTGKNKYWLCRVLTEDGQYFLQSESWTVLSDGKESKHLLSIPSRVEGKNIGRANETSEEVQATLEMLSKMERQIDKGYHEKGKKDVRTFPLPMLAHSFDDKKHTLTFPCFIQPKYNGIRCLYNSAKGFWSRQGNEILPEVTQHLKMSLAPSITLDGELLLPINYTFQQSISAIKKYDPEMSPKLVYVVYDILQENRQDTFYTRWEALLNLSYNLSDNINLAYTKKVRTHAELLEKHKYLVQLGFEGSIIRDPEGEYTCGHRSKSLLKLKNFKDEEYEITAYKEGRGKDEGAVIFECSTKSGERFDVRPEGNMETRKRMYKDAPKLIGKRLTVRYQTLTDRGVPLFPVGVTVRDYE